MRKSRRDESFRNLGKRLKDLRSRANESLAETSGAVEIEVKELASIELGEARPTEDVLLLLISHFGAKDEEAVQLWEMAGYSDDKPSQNSPAAPVAAPENPILFTDVVDVIVNNYGVVMNFMQSGPGNSSNPVARVGMSREHAKSVLQILQMTLSQTETNIQNTAKSKPSDSTPTIT